MEHAPDSQQPAVHHHRLGTIDRMLEKHGEQLEANTIASRETAVILRHVANTLNAHGEKLERATVCEQRIEHHDTRITALEQKITADTPDRNLGRYVKIGLVVLGVIYPALYQKISPVLSEIPVPQVPAVNVPQQPPSLPRTP